MSEDHLPHGFDMAKTLCLWLAGPSVRGDEELLMSTADLFFGVYRALNDNHYPRADPPPVEAHLVRALDGLTRRETRVVCTPATQLTSWARLTGLVARANARAQLLHEVLANERDELSIRIGSGPFDYIERQLDVSLQKTALTRTHLARNIGGDNLRANFRSLFTIALVNAALGDDERTHLLLSVVRLCTDCCPYGRVVSRKYPTDTWHVAVRNPPA